MYLSYWLLFTGMQFLAHYPLLLASPIVGLVFDRWISQEETDQLTLHGERFTKYCQRVPRWLSWQLLLSKTN
jgi:protein-S-isoprenylcysteine O-methyltransferase Ste14